MGVICFRASPRVRVCKLKLSAVLNSQTSPACCRSVMYIFQTSLFLTGSYDGIVRIYNESLELLQTAGGHSAPVSDASWIPPSTSVPTSRFLSSSYDTTARIYSTILMRITLQLRSHLYAFILDQSRLFALILVVNLHSLPVGITSLGCGP